MCTTYINWTLVFVVGCVTNLNRFLYATLCRLHISHQLIFWILDYLRNSSHRLYLVLIVLLIWMDAHVHCQLFYSHPWWMFMLIVSCSTHTKFSIWSCWLPKEFPHSALHLFNVVKTETVETEPNTGVQFPISIKPPGSSSQLSLVGKGLILSSFLLCFCFSISPLL